MKRYYWSLIAFLALVLVFSVLAVTAAATPEVAGSKVGGSSFDFDLVSAADYGTDRMPVIRAADPDESRRHPTETRQLLVRRDQFAILPDPVNGRELVDRIVAVQEGEPVMTETDQLQAPRRVYQRERIGPGYVVPVAPECDTEAARETRRPDRTVVQRGSPVCRCNIRTITRPSVCRARPAPTRSRRRTVSWPASTTLT